MKLSNTRRSGVSTTTLKIDYGQTGKWMILLGNKSMGKQRYRMISHKRLEVNRRRKKKSSYSPFWKKRELKITIIKFIVLIESSRTKIFRYMIFESKSFYILLNIFARISLYFKKRRNLIILINIKYNVA